MKARPPIVTIMGHVDHGKTSLLDYIRKTKVTDKEYGGITQHIGAYQIDNPKITFIDTPGHAAFIKMRARGGQVADLVILVIAANEGFKPQTEESLQHIREAKVPFLVAITKIDIPDAKIDMIKQQLADHGYPTEDRGGDVITIPISSVTGQGIDKLLESISLLAELHEVSGDPLADLDAVIIESKLDQGKGPVASLVIRNGQLSVGQQIYTSTSSVETISAKIRAIFNDRGDSIQSAFPSQPVQVLGFNVVPPVGAQILIGIPTDNPVTLPKNLPIIRPSSILSKQKLPIIVKTDVAGSNEAIKHSLPEGILLINDGIGDITEKDIFLAKNGEAQIIGFNVALTKSIANLAETEGIQAKTFTIIYELIEYLKDQYQRLIDPLYGLEIFGEAEIMAEFKINKDRIAGGKVNSGEINKEYQVRIMRDQKLIGKARIKSLRQEKQEVQKINKGTEFGALLSPYIDFKIGDRIICYK